MPLYTFESESGDTLEKVVPVGTTRLDIAGKSYVRSGSPSRFAFTGSSSGMPSQEEQVRAGYHKLEREQGSRFKSQFSKKQIKKAWGI